MTLLEVLHASTAFLEKYQVPSPKLQAELIIAHVLHLPRLQLYLQFDRPLTATERDQIRPLIKRRSHREPLQHLLGTVEFADLILETTPEALIPRPETELLVQRLRQRFSAQPPCQLYDVGTGSGALALGLANTVEGLQVTGFDTSPSALALAQRNHQRYPHLSVTWRQGNLLEGVTAPADWIVANLPYLTDAEMEALEPELAFEPKLALHGGPDGLDLIRKLIPQAKALAPALALETGIAHREPLQALLHEHGYTTVEFEQDLTGRDRFVFGTQSVP